MKRKKIIDLLLPFIAVVCVILIWEIAALCIGSEYILPDFIQTVRQVFLLFGKGEFYASLGLTLLRSLIAFAVSFILAFVFAIVSSKNGAAEKFIAPLVKITRALPTIAIVLLLLFWTNSQVAPVVVTMLVVFPTLYTNLRSALGKIDREVLEMCDLFGVPKKDVLYKVKVPRIMPDVLIAIGSGISLNLKLMVAAEVLSQTANSIGLMLNSAKVYFEISTMIALVVVVVIVGLLIETLFELLSKKADKTR